MAYDLVIAPIEILLDWIFNFIFSKIPQVGVIGAIIGVSLAVNFLALPLYNIADSLQEKERKVSRALEKRVKRIKQGFKGNERFMMLSTYYRQNNYHPLYVLRNSLSILIEIPFFIAAYHYLSHCDALKGVGFWIFKDLGKPDRLLFGYNVLPLIMTAINLVSGAIYTRGGTVREKIQMYLLALVFLVLLASSPSGLVIYWILNNLFSLAKNLVMRMKNPIKILHGVISLIFLALALYFLVSKGSLAKRLFLLAFSLLIAFLPRLPIRSPLRQIQMSTKESLILMLASGLALSLLLGLVLPSSVIASSPAEFSFLGKVDNPTTYIKNTLCIFCGFFLFWPLVIFFLFGDRVKTAESFLFVCITFTALLNAFVFTCDYGTLDFCFGVERTEVMELGLKTYVLCGAAYLILFLLIFVLFKRNKSGFVALLLVALSLGEGAYGAIKYHSINSEFSLIDENRELSSSSSPIDIEYNLSKTGKNVVVIFLDRGKGVVVPHLFEEFPEIREKYDGFVDYPNCVSFSDFTVTGAPAMMGGYEYTQEGMNAREGELLRDKHNEALLVMPKLFADAGFECTVTDVPWPNYHFLGDLDFFSPYPEIKVSEIEGKYYLRYLKEKTEDGALALENNVSCQNGAVDFAVLECLPPMVRLMFYVNARRTRGNMYAKGIDFYRQLSNLYYLKEMTGFTSTKDTFTFIENETTHNVFCDLNDDYETPSEIQTGDIVKRHYEANVAAFKFLGEWLDYLKENGVYDNTRIIIVSDHGHGENGFETHENRVSWFCPLLLFKDFNASGPVTYNSDFMTNADTLFLAKEGLGLSDTNPFTGKLLEQKKDDGVNIYHCVDYVIRHIRDATQFELDLDKAWHVTKDISNPDNWIPLKEYLK